MSQKGCPSSSIGTGVCIAVLQQKRYPPTEQISDSQGRAARFYAVKALRYLKPPASRTSLPFKELSPTALKETEGDGLIGVRIRGRGSTAEP